MNLRHLHYFLNVVEAGSVSAAADRLRITQPTLSRQLRTFEDDMGWELFTRSACSLKLTHAGQVVAEEGKKLLAQAEKARETMRTRIDGRPIRIAYAPSLGGEILRSALACFQQRHPQTRVELFDQNSEDMRRGIRNGTLDLMIEEKTGETDLAWQVLQRRPWRVALRHNDPLATREKITASDLDGKHLLLFSRLDYPAYGEKVVNYFRQEKINAKIAGEFDGVASLCLGLEAGMGIALVVAGSPFSDKVKLLPLDPAPPEIAIAVAWHTDHILDSPLQCFINELQFAAKEMIK